MKLDRHNNADDEFTSLILNMRVIIFLFFPLICHGLVNKIIDNMKFRFLGGKRVAEELDPGASTLQFLQLKSDTTPRPFSARPEKIPGLFLASIPVRMFRFAIR